MANDPKKQGADRGNPMQNLNSEKSAFIAIVHDVGSLFLKG